jgi:hypothetical protein
MTMATPPSGVIFYAVFLTVLVLVPYNYLDVERFMSPRNSAETFLIMQTEMNTIPYTALQRRTVITTKAPASASVTTIDQEPGAIRKWGCNRQETPAIFVHLAKAGGGSNRARFAAAALDYNRSEWHQPEDDHHHYPIQDEILYGEAQPQIRHAKFCNSLNNHQLVPFRDANNTLRTEKKFEGSLPCNATTPLGLAVACPQAFQRTCMGCDLAGERCDTVYVGHNYLGSELHWLPPKYLKKWWEQNWVSQQSDNNDRALVGLDRDIEETWKRLGATVNDTMWCDQGYRMQQVLYHGRVPSAREIFMGNGYYHKCVTKIAAEADRRFHAYWERREETENVRTSNDYSDIYASMPLHRMTVMREPWSWIGSKFFWHRFDHQGFVCDKDLHTWMYRLVKEYLLPFCGVDCVNRFDHGMMTYEEMYAQAESNLRQSFSVVGLLNETDQFYEMVSTRIGYLDMTRNPHVEGKKHESGGDDPNEVERCKALFMSPEYQDETKRKIPEMKLIEKLFHVGVEVNRFQREELSQCRRN